MLKSDIDIKDAELLINKTLEYKNKKTPERQLYRYILNEGAAKFSTPYYLSWEVTAACNLRCKHCCFAGQSYNPAGDIDFDRANTLVQELIDTDIIKVMLTGGEPLMRPDILEIIKKLKEHNIIIELTSNALLVNDDNANRIGRLFNPICDYIQVSVDGARAETHEFTRGAGTFSKTINGIKKLLANGVNVTINCVVTSKNLFEMSELYKLACELGVSKITFTRIFAEYNSGLRPGENELFDETVKLLKIENSKTEIELRLFTIPELAACKAFEPFAPEVSNDIQDFMCHKQEKLHIRNDGEVFLCLHSSNKNLFSLGNIKNMTLAEILENHADNVLFQRRYVSDAKCKKCAYVSMCKAGCPVNAYLKNGDINIPDPACII